MILPKSYFLNPDTIFLAKNLLGKTISTKINGMVVKGIICETEAYCGINDKACHAYGGLRTKRTETMFQEGGIIYMYLCYGIHHLLNIVTHHEGEPHAILIRGIKPIEGIDIIQKRRNLKHLKSDSCIGPGKVSQALGLSTVNNGIPLNDGLIWIEETGLKIPSKSISVGPRIGVDYAGDDAKLPYRFFIHDLSVI